MRFVLNANVGGLGRQGEIKTADPTIWRPYIDAGILSEVDDWGERVVTATSPGDVSVDGLDFLADAAGPYAVPSDDSSGVAPGPVI